MGWDERGPGVVLAPHPDDAVLSAWSALRGPGAVRVVNVCTGVPPTGTLGSFDPVFGVTDSAALVRRRVAEDARALALTGRKGTNLDFLDEQYRSSPLDVEELTRAIDAEVDGADWLCAPTGIGAHPDHVAVRDAALAIARRRGLPVYLYADLPYAIWAGWPSWVTGAVPRPYLVPEARWVADLAAIPIEGGPDALRPVPCALDESERAAKLAALRCYETQFEALNAGPLDRLCNPAILGFELYWTASP